MKRPRSRHFTTRLAATLTVMAAASLAQADGSGMPMDTWFAKGENLSITGVHVRAGGDMPVSQMKQVIRSLDTLAERPEAVRDLLGPSWRVRKVGRRELADVYRDDSRLGLAQTGGFVRDRAHGIDGRKYREAALPAPKQLAGDQRISISTRTSNEDRAGSHKRLPAFEPAAGLRASVRSKQTITIYALQRKDKRRGWEPVIDILAEQVTATAARPARAGAKQTTRFGHLAVVLNRPGSPDGRTLVPGVSWTAPHTAADAHRPEVLKDPHVRRFLKVAPKILDQTGAKITPTASTYATAARRLGLLTSPPRGRSAR